METTRLTFINFRNGPTLEFIRKQVLELANYVGVTVLDVTVRQEYETVEGKTIFGNPKTTREFRAYVYEVTLQGEEEQITSFKDMRNGWRRGWNAACDLYRG